MINNHEQKHWAIEKSLDDNQADIDANTTAIAALQNSQVMQGTWAARPGSPANNQLYFANDRDILYQYNSTFGRWLTVQQYEVPLIGVPPQQYSADTAHSHYQAVNHFPYNTEFLIEHFEVTCATTATFDGTHFWVSRLGTYSSAGVYTEIISNQLYATGKTGAAQIYEYPVAGNNTIYNTTNAPVLFTSLYRSLGGAAAGSIYLYKQSAWIRVAG